MAVTILKQVMEEKLDVNNVEVTYVCVCASACMFTCMAFGEKLEAEVIPATLTWPYHRTCLQ